MYSSFPRAFLGARRILSRPTLKNNKCHGARWFTTSQEMVDYLNNLGIKREMHETLLASIRPVVIGSFEEEEIMTVAQVKAAFQDTNDLMALSHSLEQQTLKKAKKSNKKKRQQRLKRDVVVRFPNSTDSSTTLTWKYGESLLDLFQSFPGQQALLEGQQNDIMEGPCGGHCS